MEAALKELEKLETLTSRSPEKGKFPSIIDYLDNLLQRFTEAKTEAESVSQQRHLHRPCASC